MSIDHRHPELGARNTNGTCAFTVWAPLHNRISLHLEKNASVFPMTRDENGYWSVVRHDIAHGDRYWIEVDGKEKFPDPASRWQPEGVHGPSAVADSDFSWEDISWKGIPLAEMIIYEIHTGTFSDAGTFEGVLSKLDHIVSLGVNAIEVMPIAQFPGTRNWGYDGVFPFAVQHSYGGVNGLKRLVNEAHKRGIAVILDVVYNHQGPEGNYFSMFAPYFTEKYKTGWGSAINFDDAYCDGVREFYWSNALQWLDEFHVDGLRLDAVHAIWDFSAKHFIEGLVEKIRALEAKTRSKKVLIAEIDLNNPRYINAKDVGGYGMDGQWIDEFHHALRALVTGDLSGYYEDFGATQHLAKAMRDSYVYTGEYSVHRKKKFGVKPTNCYSQFIVFAQNHDQIGNRLLGDRLTTTLSLDALKLIAATVLLSPHVPMLFMGEEYGETNPFQYFISHTDEALIENVRRGRKEEFKHFHWEGDIPDPQSEETFKACKLSWDISPNSRQVLLEYYRYLIAFRKERLAMKGIERSEVMVFEMLTDKVMAFTRRHQRDEILVVMNFNKTGTVCNPPRERHAWKIFDSSSPRWLGVGEITPLEIPPHETISLQPESILIFEFI